MRVTFTDGAGNDESLTSNTVLSAPPLIIPDEDVSNTQETGVPTISGTAQAGETLTVDTSAIADGGPTDATFTYQWPADGSEIPDATASTYTVAEADVGRTLRDHAITVTGGEMTGARRLVRNGDSRNLRWEISVRPDGNGAVTIVLPATADCNDEGAICTSDGRKLSNRLELLVPGPAG